MVNLTSYTSIKTYHEFHWHSDCMVIHIHRLSISLHLFHGVVYLASFPSMYIALAMWYHSSCADHFSLAQACASRCHIKQRISTEACVLNRTQPNPNQPGQLSYITLFTQHVRSSQEGSQLYIKSLALVHAWSTHKHMSSVSNMLVCCSPFMQVP